MINKSAFVRRVIIFLSVIATAVAASAQSRSDLVRLVNQTLSARVTSVTDGDTISAKLDATGQIIKVRLEGIDCPENGEPYSGQARNTTRVMLFDKRVSLTATDVDQYDRLVARVTVEGKDSSVALLRAGFACHFKRYSSDERLAAAEREARQTHMGFWATGAPKPGCAKFADVGTAIASPGLRAITIAGPFSGNRQSRVYHAATCKNYKCGNCTVRFDSADEAEKAGYRPAGDCLR